jgi:hypothetical protein
LKIDLAELFLTREQIAILRSHRENKVERLKDAVMRELSETVTRLVRQELERSQRADEPAAKRRAAKR